MRYRFIDAMGEVAAEQEFDDRSDALAWTGADEDGEDLEIYRVEYLGPEGDWRWAGTPGGAG